MGIPLRQMMAQLSSDDIAWYRAYAIAEQPKPPSARERFTRQLGKGVIKRAT